MTLVSQAEFARLKGVSRKTVTVWKSQQRLVISGDQVDVEASQRLLGAAASSKTAGQAAAVTQPVTQVTPTPAVTRLEAQPHGGALKRDRAEGEPGDVVDTDEFVAGVMAGKVFKVADSERIKEGALAVKQVLQARQAAGELIETELAEAVFFEAARAARDSWLNWPSRVGPLIAADLNLPADRVTEVLTAHVQAHLAELGEPEPPDFTDPTG